jgi:hypothetical protein
MRVSEGIVCWLCGTRRTTELHYILTPSPLNTQSRSVRHRLRNYKVGTPSREEYMFFHKLFNIPGFPLVFLEPDNADIYSYTGIVLYLLNLLLLSRLIAYLINKWKEA